MCLWAAAIIKWTMDRLRYQRRKFNLLHSRTAGRAPNAHLQCREEFNGGLGGVGGGWRGGTMQIKFASVIMQPPHPPTHSPPSPVSQAHAVPWRRANHFKRLRNTAALSSRRRSIHFLFYIFHLNSLLHSCLNLFQSGAIETDLQVAAELYLGRVASCPVHMPTREARGRELSIKSPLQTCGRSRNERKKKKNHEQTGRLRWSRSPHVMHIG